MNKIVVIAIAVLFLSVGLSYASGSETNNAGPISSLNLEISYTEELPQTKTLSEGQEVITVTSGLNEVVKGKLVYDPELYFGFDPTSKLLTSIQISWIDPNINDPMYGQRIVAMACEGGNNTPSTPTPGLPVPTDGMVVSKPQVSLSKPPATKTETINGMASCFVCPSGFSTTTTGLCNDGSSYVTGYIIYKGAHTKNTSTGSTISASITATVGAAGFNYIGEDWAVDLNSKGISQKPCVTYSDFPYCYAFLTGTLKATLTPD